MTNNNKWIIEVQEDIMGDCFIELPSDFLELNNWKEGDTLEWVDNHDGSWTLKKKG